MITIPPGIQDPSYRYKMPVMELKAESRLNGAKTNIVNIEEVAAALRVPSIAIMKYFSSELGANMEQTSIIKGTHVYSQMLKHLDGFIKKYICCKGCNYPELSMYVEAKDLKSKCNSCGKLNNHDAIHKAGKALYNHFKSGKGQIVDITQKDKKKDVEVDDTTEKKKSKKDKDKKDKKDKDKKDKDKKKKKDKAAEKEDGSDKDEK